jgi:hypothetical protein
VQFYASRPVGSFYMTPMGQTGDRGGAFTGGVIYYSSPQYEMDINVWYAVGRKLGFIPPNRNDWLDKLSTAVGYAVIAAGMIGIAYGGSLAIAQASAAGAAASAAPVAATASPFAAPAAAVVTSAPAAVGAGATSFTAAGAVKTAALYAAQAKDIFGVGMALKNVLSAKAPVAPVNLAPSAAPAETTAPLWLGGAALAAILAFKFL